MLVLLNLEDMLADLGCESVSAAATVGLFSLVLIVVQRWTASATFWSWFSVRLSSPVTSA